FEALLVDRQRVLGVDHPDTLTTRNNLASCLARAGRVDEAIAQFEALLNDCLRVLGPDHPLTKNVREALERLKREDESDASPKQP
uniref:tetratricopeptide repeat protein n=1 Tax=Schaalia cardiffensis TaxID=181487 RepID=UPI0023F5310F